jgi:hypothetical protein
MGYTLIDKPLEVKFTQTSLPMAKVSRCEKNHSKIVLLKIFQYAY